jgi:hypothetical protein
MSFGQKSWVSDFESLEAVRVHIEEVQINHKLIFFWYHHSSFMFFLDNSIKIYFEILIFKIHMKFLLFLVLGMSRFRVGKILFYIMSSSMALHMVNLKSLYFNGTHTTLLLYLYMLTKFSMNTLSCYIGIKKL